MKPAWALSESVSVRIYIFITTSPTSDFGSSNFLILLSSKGDLIAEFVQWGYIHIRFVGSSAQMFSMYVTLGSLQ